jgi:anaerobic selenocysteine-containing dehydrogenase/Fe-S-cluster-containing dehydrogenase component
MGVSFGAFGVMTLGYERLIPFVHQPDEVIPGVSTWYATSCRECPAGCAMVMRSRESRVVKCEGNPYHPVNGGTLCARGQAALHGLYDPDRIKGPLRKNHKGEFEAVKWDDALNAVASELGGEHMQLWGSHTAFVSDLQTGSLELLMRRWLGLFGSRRLILYEPISYENVKGIYDGVVPSYNIADCDYLVSFGADFLDTWISPVEYARQFAEMRKVKNGKRARFVYVGSRMSMTAMNADDRIIVPPGAIADVGVAAFRDLIYTNPPSGLVDKVARKYGINGDVLRRIRSGYDSASNPVVLPQSPDHNPPALADRNRPHAVTRISDRADMMSLTSYMESGGIYTLIIHGANPVYSLPESSRFKEALKKVKTVISLSSYMDETTAEADWVLPSNTPLESWGDYSPYPDVTNLMQPTMGRMFDTKQTGDILMELARRVGVDTQKAFKADTFYEYLRLRWGAPVAAGTDGDTSAPAWESALQIGGSWPGAEKAATPVNGYQIIGWSVKPAVSGVTPPAANPIAAGEPGALFIDPPAAASGTESGKIKLLAFPHTYLYDGRGANRRWLQEIPEPVTKAVWGTWAEVHPETARKLGLMHDPTPELGNPAYDVVEIKAGGASIQVPIYVWEGVAPDTIAVPMGGGHTEYGRYAKGTGVNVLALLETDNPEVEIRATGEKKWVTRIKGSMEQHDRNIVQTVALGEPERRKEKIVMPLPAGYEHRDFYPPHEDQPHRWAMVVDLDRCIGCHACVTACYAENNLAVVGPDGIYRQREMPWLRIDRYVDFESSTPMLFQPMLCQQCDAAPCEPVCPMYAAAHSDEGLNMQIYNRCIGTRYCSHNCPYKVRRFNWYDYKWPHPLNYQLNPDVTVRQRGVMEKCTFCIQRIREAEIVAKREGRPVRDGEIAPACAQTCPTRVFTFGDLKDPKSEVSRIFNKDPRAYQALGELNTKPAVLYLKKRVG